MTVFLGLMIPFLAPPVRPGCFSETRWGQMFRKHFLVLPPELWWQLLSVARSHLWIGLLPWEDWPLSRLRRAVGRHGFSALWIVIPHLHMGAEKAEGPSCSLKKYHAGTGSHSSHNIPEGKVAVGVVFAGMLAENAHITTAAAFARYWYCHSELPEGAIIPFR